VLPTLIRHSGQTLKLNENHQNMIESVHIISFVTFFFQTSEATTGLGHLYLILTGEPWLRRGTAAAFKFCSSSLLSSQYHPGVDPFPLAVDEILPELILNWAHWGYPLVMKNQSLHIRD
jgi:hypothetical protein